MWVKDAFFEMLGPLTAKATRISLLEDESRIEVAVLGRPCRVVVEVMAHIFCGIDIYSPG